MIFWCKSLLFINIRMKTFIRIKENYCYYKIGIRFTKYIEKKKGSTSLKTKGKSRAKSQGQAFVVNMLCYVKYYKTHKSKLIAFAGVLSTRVSTCTSEL